MFYIINILKTNINFDKFDFILYKNFIFNNQKYKN